MAPSASTSTDPRFQLEEEKLDFDEQDEQKSLSDEEPSEGEYEGTDGLNPAGFAGPSEPIVKPLTTDALAAFRAEQERTGVLYISRIPPGMRPTKVRHLMSQYGEVGRVYLQQEDPKRAYLRKKFTSTKKAHYTEGWVEFKDKRVARSVADMLNAQPIGGKKGTRWRDDIWTMKYLPKFKWNMLTEQIAHEAAVHTARLRVELSQSRTEQRDYLRNVELARVLDKRADRKRKALSDGISPAANSAEEPKASVAQATPSKPQRPDQTLKKRRRVDEGKGNERQLAGILDSIF